MDKALIEIKEKELKLEELYKQKALNNMKKEEIKNIDLINSINYLENSKLAKKIGKNNLLTNLDKLKKEKKYYISIVMLLFMILDIIMFFEMPIPRDLVEFNLVTLLTGSTIFASTFGTFSLLQHREKKQLKFLEKEMGEISSKLEKEKPLLEEMNKAIDPIEKENANIDLQINEIKNRIEYLNQIRSEVIKSFCQDNSELNLLIDNEYNKSENVKQKVNKK